MTQAIDEPILVKSPFFDVNLEWCCSWYDYDVFNNLLDAVAMWCVDRLKNDNQCVIIIRGDTGSGKSHLAMQLIKRICTILKIPFNIRDMYLYSLIDLAEKIDRKCPNPINWYDEGSVTFNSLDSTSETGKLMGMFFDTMRIDHYISVVCMPNDKEMNGRIIKHANLFLECPKKVPLPDFSAKGFFEVYHRIVYKSGKHFDRCLGAGIFRPMSKKVCTEYDAIKRQKADEFKQMLAKKLLNKAKRKGSDSE